VQLGKKIQKCQNFQNLDQISMKMRIADFVGFWASGLRISKVQLRTALVSTD